MDSVDAPLIEEVSPGRKREIHPALIALIIVGSVLLIGGVAVIIVVVATSSSEPTTDYGIIIDAGSSGSRIYVYEWPHRKDHTTIPVVSPLYPNETLQNLHIRQLRSNREDLVDKVSPGIAKIDPKNVSFYLQPLLHYANSLVPDDQKERTPIFLFATAGMRLLANDTLKEAILAAVRDTLSNTTFNFTYKDDWARIITGADEGVYGWVTANYLKKVLFEDDAKKRSFGALDLGGASLQITFLPEETPKENSQTLPLPNNVFELYTYSFLRFGQDQTLKRILDIVVDELKTKTGSIPEYIPFSCYLVGYNETLTIDGVNHTVYGTGSFENCSVYENIFMNRTVCPVEPCSMDGVYQPKVKGDFYAMSGFYFTANFFGFASETEKCAPVKFKEYGSDYCAKSWEQAREEARKKDPTIKDDYVKMYCLTSSYIYNILTTGFGFDENDARIYFTGAINGTSLNWALGGLIAEASLLPK